MWSDKGQKSHKRIPSIWLNDPDPPARSAHPPQLTQNSCTVGNVVQHVSAENEIKSRVRERKTQSVSTDKDCGYTDSLCELDLCLE